MAPGIYLSKDDEIFNFSLEDWWQEEKHPFEVNS